MKSIARFLIIAGLVMAVGSAPAAADHDKGPTCTDIVATTDGTYVVLSGIAVVTVELFTQGGICQQVTYRVTVTNASGAVVGTSTTATSCGPSCLQISVDVGAVAGAPRTVLVTATTSIGNHVFDTATKSMTLCEPPGDLYPDIPECAPPAGAGFDE